MTDNRALWELVEKWINHYAPNEIEEEGYLAYERCSKELREILERPVVVSDEDVQHAVSAWNGPVPTGTRHGTKHLARMRAALESMVRGKS